MLSGPVLHSKFLPSIIKIFKRVFDLQSGHEINGLSLSNITKGDKGKSKKGRVVILICDMLSGPVLHFCQVPSKYSKGCSSYRADTKSFSNKTKGDNSKSKKARVVILICDMSSRPGLHFYQVSSKYSKGYSSYRGDKKIYADTDANRIHPKNKQYVPPPPPPGSPLVGVGGDIISPAPWCPCFLKSHDGSNNLSRKSSKEQFCHITLKSVQCFLTRRFLVIYVDIGKISLPPWRPCVLTNHTG